MLYSKENSEKPPKDYKTQNSKRFSPLFPLGVAGASVGMGIVGKQLESEPLQEAGETTGKFIKPAVNIVMGGYIVNQLRNLKPNKKDKFI